MKILLEYYKKCRKVSAIIHFYYITKTIHLLKKSYVTVIEV